MPTTTPPTAASQIENFNHDLFDILNSVGSKQAAQDAAQVSSLNAFMKAEGTLITKATEIFGPSPRFVAPSWKGGKDPKRLSYEDAFRKVIVKVLEAPTASEDEQAIETVGLMMEVKSVFKQVGDGFKLFPFTDDKGKAGKQATPSQLLCLDWVGDATILLNKSIGEPKQKALLNALNEFVQKNQSKFSGWFNDKFWDESGTGTWETSFVPTIKKALGITSEGQKDEAIQEKADFILGKLEQSFKLQPQGPNGEVSDEEVIRAWVNTTVIGLQTPHTVTTMQKEMLLSGLEDVITDMFPQPDLTSFYGSAQTMLINNILELPDIHEAGVTGKMVKDPTTGAMHYEPVQGAPGDAVGKGLKYWISQKVSASNPTIADNGKLNGVAELAPALDAIAADLEKQLTDVVKQAIAQVFLSLSEQGVQGRMISATYDHQIINRIATYTNSLLEQLDTHLDVDIPENSDNSLTAAKEITAASVSFRSYTDALNMVLSEFNNAKGTGGKSAKDGMSVSEITGLVEGSKPSPGFTSKGITEVTQELYTSQSTPDPLIKRSELAGVKLAAESAGLSSSLKDLLINERKQAVIALNNLRTNSQKLFEGTQTEFATSSKAYFEALDDYTSSREAYEIDETLNAAITSSLAGLTDIMEKGSAGFEAAAAGKKS